MAGTQTIKSVLDLQNGKEINALEFFNQPEHELFPYRRVQEEAYQGIGEPKFLCYFCKQVIKIKGGFSDGGKVKMHFAHFKDSDECPIKTNNRLSREEIDAMKYNGAKESRDHIETKNKIGELLELNESENKGVSEVIIDQILRSERITALRRKPDVRCLYKTDRLVFEIQLSTTYISVIADREHFYKQEGAYLLWIFKHFHVNPDEQTYTEKDIYYSNYQNVFVLDEDAIAHSTRKNDLVLHCYFNKHNRQGNHFWQKWEEEFVTLSNLTFDDVSRKAYYYNPDLHYKKLQLELKKEQADQEKKERKILEQKRKKQEARQKEILEKVEREKKGFEDFKRRQAELKQKEIEREKEKLANEIRKSQKFNQLFKAIEQKEQVTEPERPDEIFQVCLQSMRSRSKLVNIYLADSETMITDLLELFKEGYQPTADDEIFLDQQHKIALERSTRKIWRLHIECLYVSIFYLKVNKIEFADCYPKIRFILSGLLSLKLELGIFQSNLTLPDFITELVANCPEYAGLINKAVSVFEVADIQQFAAGNEHHEFDWIFKAIFPELFS